MMTLLFQTQRAINLVSKIVKPILDQLPTGFKNRETKS